jgi:hypothetical protein
LLLSAIAPFEAMFNPAAPMQTSGAAQAAPAEVEQLRAADAWNPVPEPVAVPAAPDGRGGNGHGSSAAAAQPEPAHSTSAEPADGGTPNENGDETRHRPFLVPTESNGVPEGFQILPSRRGQYKTDDLEYREGGQ